MLSRILQKNAVGTAPVLCSGAAGIHRFYVGKNKTGILWLVTGGLLGVGVLVDYVRIAAGWFTDQDGLRLKL
jgi:TM2 domain-containing membrane protein YozV